MATDAYGYPVSSGTSPNGVYDFNGNLIGTVTSNSSSSSINGYPSTNSSPDGVYDSAGNLIGTVTSSSSSRSSNNSSNVGYFIPGSESGATPATPLALGNTEGSEIQPTFLEEVLSPSKLTSSERYDLYNYRNTAEGKELSGEVQEQINELLFPRYGATTNRDNAFNNIVNTVTDGGLDGLAANDFILNEIERAAGVEIMNLPDVGHLISRTYETFVPVSLQNALDGTGGFMSAGVQLAVVAAQMNGTLSEAQASLASNIETAFNDDALNFDYTDNSQMGFVERMFADPMHSNAARFGSPLTTTAENQQIVSDYLYNEEFLSKEEINDYYTSQGLDPQYADTDRGVLQAIAEFSSAVVDGGIDTLRELNFEYKKYFGGEIAQNAIKAGIQSSSLGYLSVGGLAIPVAFILYPVLEMASDALSPDDGQEFRDFIAEDRLFGLIKGIGNDEITQDDLTILSGEVSDPVRGAANILDLAANPLKIVEGLYDNVIAKIPVVGDLVSNVFGEFTPETTPEERTAALQELYTQAAYNQLAEDVFNATPEQLQEYLDRTSEYPATYDELVKQIDEYYDEQFPNAKRDAQISDLEDQYQLLYDDLFGDDDFINGLNDIKLEDYGSVDEWNQAQDDYTDEYISGLDDLREQINDLYGIEPETGNENGSGNDMDNYEQGLTAEEFIDNYLAENPPSTEPPAGTEGFYLPGEYEALAEEIARNEAMMEYEAYRYREENERPPSQSGSQSGGPGDTDIGGDNLTDDRWKPTYGGEWSEETPYKITKYDSDGNPYTVWGNRDAVTESAGLDQGGSFDEEGNYIPPENDGGITNTQSTVPGSGFTNTPDVSLPDPTTTSTGGSGSGGSITIEPQLPVVPDPDDDDDDNDNDGPIGPNDNYDGGGYNGSCDDEEYNARVAEVGGLRAREDFKDCEKEDKITDEEKTQIFNESLERYLGMGMDAESANQLAYENVRRASAGEDPLPMDEDARKELFQTDVEIRNLYDSKFREASFRQEMSLADATAAANAVVEARTGITDYGNINSDRVRPGDTWRRDLNGNWVRETYDGQDATYNFDGSIIGGGPDFTPEPTPIPEVDLNDPNVTVETGTDPETGDVTTITMNSETGLNVTKIVDGETGVETTSWIDPDTGEKFNVRYYPDTDFTSTQINDSDGNFVSLKHSQGNTVVEVDENNQTINTYTIGNGSSDPSTSTNTETYADSSGNIVSTRVDSATGREVTTVTGPGGLETTHTTDPQGNRVVTERTSSGTVTTWTTDSNNNTTIVQTRSDGISTTWDPSGNVTTRAANGSVMIPTVDGSAGINNGNTGINTGPGTNTGTTEVETDNARRAREEGIPYLRDRQEGQYGAFYNSEVDGIVFIDPPRSDVDSGKGSNNTGTGSNNTGTGSNNTDVGSGSNNTGNPEDGMFDHGNGKFLNYPPGMTISVEAYGLPIESTGVPFYNPETDQEFTPDRDGFDSLAGTAWIRDMTRERYQAENNTGSTVGQGNQNTQSPSVPTTPVIPGLVGTGNNNNNTPNPGGLPPIVGQPGYQDPTLDNRFTTGGGNPNAPTGNVNYGEAFDPTFGLLQVLYGDEVANRYRGGGLAQVDAQNLIDRYQRQVEDLAFGRTASLAGQEQNLVNTLRDIQRDSDLGLLENYGTDFAAALYGTDPVARRQMQYQSALSDELYNEALGNFSPSRQAQITEDAFQTSALQGRERDPSMLYERLLGSESARADRQARAQAAGGNTFNMSRDFTRQIPGMILGGGYDPSGDRTISPVYGAIDAVGAAQQNYQNTQDLMDNARAQAAYNAAIAAAQRSDDLTLLETINNGFDQFNAGLATVDGFFGVLRGLGGSFQGIADGLQQVNFPGSAGLGNVFETVGDVASNVGSIPTPSPITTTVPAVGNGTVVTQPPVGNGTVVTQPEGIDTVVTEPEGGSDTVVTEPEGGDANSAGTDTTVTTTAPAFNENTFTGFDDIAFQEEAQKYIDGVSTIYTGADAGLRLLGDFGVGQGNQFYDDYLNTDLYKPNDPGFIEGLFGFTGNALSTGADAVADTVTTGVGAVTDGIGAVVDTAKTIAGFFGSLFD